MAKFIPLTESNVFDFIGKKVTFTAEGYNKNYCGMAVIKAVNKNTIECDRISGDDLRFAFLDDHGLETTDGGGSYHVVKNNKCYSYSDSYREIFVSVCE